MTFKLIIGPLSDTEMENPESMEQLVGGMLN